MHEIVPKYQKLTDVENKLIEGLKYIAGNPKESDEKDPDILASQDIQVGTKMLRAIDKCVEKGGFVFVQSQNIQVNLVQIRILEALSILKDSKKDLIPDSDYIDDCMDQIEGLREIVLELKLEVLRRAFIKCNRNMTRAAMYLGIPPDTFRRILTPEHREKLDRRKTNRTKVKEIVETDLKN